MPTPDPSPAPGAPRSLVARAGFVASAFAVFLCGWLAVQTSDWRKMLLYSVLAVGAASVASAFRRGRR